MKIFPVLLCSVCLAVAGYAQAPAAAGNAQQFTPQELDQLVGPVALYPDELLGLILPASTVPSDIVVADRYLGGGGDPAQIANQPWDDSVKGLTHYPDLLKWLDQNIAWTTQLGTAYATQPSDVMDSIQQLRAQARADGTLVSNAQQVVVVGDDGEITINPTDPNTVYAPTYDPDAVFDDNYSTDDGALITYDDGYPVGPWLVFWPNWYYRGIYYGDWRYHGRPGFAANDPSARPWHPNPNRVQYRANVAPGVVLNTKPLPGVSIIHAKHPATAPGGSYAPQRDFRGRAAVVQPQVQAPQQPVISGYGRGSDARAASQRGQFSRQFNGVVAQPVAPVAAPVVERPPVQQMRPVTPVYQGMNSGAGASAAGARGAASRFGR